MTTMMLAPIPPEGGFWSKIIISSVGADNQHVIVFIMILSCRPQSWTQGSRGCLGLLLELPSAGAPVVQTALGPRGQMHRTQ